MEGAWRAHGGRDTLSSRVTRPWSRALTACSSSSALATAAGRSVVGCVHRYEAAGSSLERRVLSRFAIASSLMSAGRTCSSDTTRYSGCDGSISAAPFGVASTCSLAAAATSARARLRTSTDAARPCAYSSRAAARAPSSVCSSRGSEEPRDAAAAASAAASMKSLAASRGVSGSSSGSSSCRKWVHTLATRSAMLRPKRSISIDAPPVRAA